jgi:hypothetical protein
MTTTAGRFALALTSMGAIGIWLTVLYGLALRDVFTPAAAARRCATWRLRGPRVIMACGVTMAAGLVLGYLAEGWSALW